VKGSAIRSGWLRPLLLLAALLAISAPGHARLQRVQSDMPVIPPPGQRQQQQQQQQQPAPAPRVISIDDLARLGFDVKAIDRAGQAEGRYVVVMQRGGEVRTCLMTLDLQRGQPPRRQSACF
jgi:hypothetical protein